MIEPRDGFTSHQTARQKSESLRARRAALDKNNEYESPLLLR